MAKGSGRRRKVPADGIKYDPETELTNLDKIGAKSFESRTYHGIYHSMGAQPTKWKDYGSHNGTGTNGRYGGRGRKNDYRCWKSYTKGKQYDRDETREGECATRSVLEGT